MKSFKATTQQLHIVFGVQDCASHNMLNFHFRHSMHSMQRADQRGFHKLHIALVLHYGHQIYKQGLVFFILGEHLPHALLKYKAHLKNSVVVVSGTSNQVITCYRSVNPFRHIRRKKKWLTINSE